MSTKIHTTDIHNLFKTKVGYDIIFNIYEEKIKGTNIDDTKKIINDMLEKTIITTSVNKCNTNTIIKANNPETKAKQSYEYYTFKYRNNNFIEVKNEIIEKFKSIGEESIAEYLSVRDPMKLFTKNASKDKYVKTDKADIDKKYIELLRQLFGSEKKGETFDLTTQLFYINFLSKPLEGFDKQFKELDLDSPKTHQSNEPINIKVKEEEKEKEEEEDEENEDKENEDEEEKLKEKLAALALKKKNPLKTTKPINLDDLDDL